MIARTAQHIEAISLDFYGTLIFPRNGRGRGANLVEYLRSQGLEPGPYEHRMLYEIFDRHDTDYAPDLPADERARYLARLTGRALEALAIGGDDSLAETHKEAVWRILGPESFALYPETRAVLTTLRSAEYPLVLLSNWQHGLAHFAAELGIADAFDHLISSAELGAAKPERRIFDEACERLGVAPERVLHVGDTPVDDYDGARAAGLKTILLYRGDGPAPNGVDVIRDLLQLLPRVPTA